MIFKFRYFLILFFFPILLSTYYLLPAGIIFADTDGVTLTVTISQNCGNGVTEGSEQCDGSDLSGETCVSLGYTSSALSCNADCNFNVSTCSSVAPITPSGGGGDYVPPSTAVTFFGRAYPKSTIILLKDARVAATTVANDDASFKMSLSGLSAGNFVFSIYSKDKNGLRSPLLTFTVSVTAGVTTNISGIFIAPTIAVDKSEVKKGDNIGIFGQGVPNTKINIFLNSDISGEFFYTTKTDKSGDYFYNFNTALLGMGRYIAKIKTTLKDETSSFSKEINFTVGTKNIISEFPKEEEKGDINGDGRVNLIDVSILIFWFDKFSVPPEIDLNSDGRVNLVDFSIMAYYWTG